MGKKKKEKKGKLEGKKSQNKVVDGTLDKKQQARLKKLVPCDCKSKCCKKFQKCESKRCKRCPCFDLLKKVA